MVDFLETSQILELVKLPMVKKSFAIVVFKQKKNQTGLLKYMSFEYALMVKDQALFQGH